MSVRDMKKILVVDDETAILNSLRRVLSNLSYDVLVADSGIKALTLMSEQQVDLVISDMRMPGMDGYELLSHIKTLYPNTVRIILSGYADEKLVMKALLKNIARTYLFKPWNNQELAELIEYLFETEKLLQSNLLSMINNAEDLPTIKSSFSHILSLIDQDAEIAVVAKAITEDQTVVGKILHIANSAFYGLKTGSVMEAIKYLGLKAIRDIVLSTPIMDAFRISGRHAVIMDRQWNHAFYTNKVLVFLYEKFYRKKLLEIEGNAGLLHNIGCAFLIKHRHADYMAIKKRALQESVFDSDLERENLGFTHCEAGGYLLSWWDLPYPIVECALYHHTPFDKRIINKELVMSVHLAQKYACDFILEKPTEGFYPEVYEALSVDRDKFDWAISELKE